MNNSYILLILLTSSLLRNSTTVVSNSSTPVGRKLHSSRTVLPLEELLSHAQSFDSSRHKRMISRSTCSISLKTLLDSQKNHQESFLFSSLPSSSKKSFPSSPSTFRPCSHLHVFSPLNVNASTRNALKRHTPSHWNTVTSMPNSGAPRTQLDISLSNLSTVPVHPRQYAGNVFFLYPKRFLPAFIPFELAFLVCPPLELTFSGYDVFNATSILS